MIPLEYQFICLLVTYICHMDKNIVKSINNTTKPCPTSQWENKIKPEDGMD